MLALNEMDLRTLLGQIHQFSGKQRWACVGVLWVLFGVLGYAMWWRADLEQAEQQHIQITEALSRLNTQSALLIEQPQLEVELAKLQAQLPVLQKALPTDRELAALLDRIHQAIRSNHMGLAEFVPAESENQEVMRVVPVRLRVSGAGNDMSRLPNHVAQLTRQATLQDFEVQLSDKGGWQMAGMLLAYAQLPPNSKAVKAAEAP
jgi:type IV pilus assembly protein PilO